MTKILPREITSYDLFKTFAVLTMVIDHMGYYFSPDDLWWRAVGRASFPVWFFLIGYARERAGTPMLLGGALALLAANIVAGLPVFPLNALFTIMLIRATLDPLMAFSLASRRRLWFVSALLFLAAFPDLLVTEYGTLALLMAIFGYLARNCRKDKKTLRAFMAFSLIGYIAVEKIYFAFSFWQFAVMVLLSAPVWILLYDFRPRAYPVLTARLGVPGASAIEFCGRHTLEIYVLHLLLFKVLVLIMGLKETGLFHWTWV